MIRRGLILVLALLWGGALARDGLDAWIDRTDLPPLDTETSVEVLDRDGTLLRAYTVADGRWRLAVTPDAVDPGYLEMLIAYEDKRFYRHHGIDPLAMARAAGQALRRGQVVSGASTLTMQVARLLEDSGTGRWQGKLRQMRVALALERRLTKAQILTLYLNRAPFGGNVEGLRAATLGWFGKPPQRLTAAQAALMVALPQSPETRRPDRHPDVARIARARVLDRLSASGALAADRAQAALREPIPRDRIALPALAPHLADRALRDKPDAGTHHLTLDAGLQAGIEALASAALNDRGAELSVAMVIADHRTGAVLASVGSPGLGAEARQGYVDMTVALRSPGSTLKPLIYGLAFGDGLAHPETIITDRPTSFGGYAPGNFDGQFRGDVTMRRALELSLNLPAVVLTDALGPARLMTHLRRAGMVPEVPGGKPGLAVALGGLGVTLEDLARLYAAIANGGQPVPLHWRAGDLPPAPGARVLPDVAAWQVADILRGTPTPANVAPRRIAFKTGTSYGHRDAWAVGFDGAHVVAVWMGRPDGTPVPGAFGGELAAPVMFEAFARIKPTPTPLRPPPPATLIASNAELPQPLQRFRGRDAVFARQQGGPDLIFPPNGAELERDAAGLVLKLRDGTPPYTVLANGAPLVTGLRRFEVQVPTPGPGFVTFTVIDAKGRTAETAIRLN
ncbi:penicillin-binding protein 1C [Actibacterium sp.]|uniref:penicillin-binding protein 1C n=1 Tax=Actibacterium sp. TaxID=1872125 RepID=UPI0035682A79